MRAFSPQAPASRSSEVTAQAEHLNKLLLNNAIKSLYNVIHHIISPQEYKRQHQSQGVLEALALADDILFAEHAAQGVISNCDRRTLDLATPG